MTLQHVKREITAQVENGNMFVVRAKITPLTKCILRLGVMTNAKDSAEVGV